MVYGAAYNGFSRGQKLSTYDSDDFKINHKISGLQDQLLKQDQYIKKIEKGFAALSHENDALRQQNDYIISVLEEIKQTKNLTGIRKRDVADMAEGCLLIVGKMSR